MFTAGSLRAAGGRNDPNRLRRALHGATPPEPPGEMHARLGPVKRKNQGAPSTANSRRLPKRLLAILLVGAFSASLFALTRYESYRPLYDAEYVGSATCGECHSEIYSDWQDSSHALMVRSPSTDSVVGDFEDHAWRLPPEFREKAGATPVARMQREVRRTRCPCSTPRPARTESSRSSTSWATSGDRCICTASREERSGVCPCSGRSSDRSSSPTGTTKKAVHPRQRIS